MTSVGINETRPVRSGGQDRPRRSVGFWALVLVIGGLIANLGFNLYLGSRGLGAPFNSTLFGHEFNTFLYEPRDRFADLLKMAMSYPGGAIQPVDPWWGLDARLDLFRRQLVKFEGTPLNHFHMLPLSTLAGLTFRASLSVVHPGLLVVIAIGTAAAALAVVVSQAAPKGLSRLWFGMLALACYPALFAFDRGHMFALTCGICLIAAIARTFRLRHPDWLTMLFFTVAINIRPHAALIPLAFFLFSLRWRFRDLAVLGIGCGGLFLICMAIANAIYPAYDFASFLKGLDDYSKLHFVRDFGQAYNSSLFGALRALFGFSQWTYAIPLYVVLGLVVATWAMVKRSPSPPPPAVLVYLALAGYALGSQVFLDYHLLVFLAPLVLLARDGAGGRAMRRTVMIGCCLVLMPKNFIYHSAGGVADWSWQVVFNPAILLITSAYLLSRGFAMARIAEEVETKAAEPPPGSPAAIVA
jgi:hypothetical protein